MPQLREPPFGPESNGVASGTAAPYGFVYRNPMPWHLAITGDNAPRLGARAQVDKCEAMWADSDPLLTALVKGFISTTSSRSGCSATSPPNAGQLTAGLAAPSTGTGLRGRTRRAGRPRNGPRNGQRPGAAPGARLNPFSNYHSWYYHLRVLRFRLGSWCRPAPHP